MTTKAKKISVRGTRDMVFTALFAAILAAVAPFSVDIGPVPLTFATLIIYLASIVLGAKRAVMAVLIYILLGGFGLPVFSRFQGGFHVIAGMTGGFLIGYIPLAFAVGFFADKFRGNVFIYAVGIVIGTILLYTVGVVWFMFLTGNTLMAALAICVFPFLPGDALKAVAACAIAPKLRKAIMQRNTAA